MRCSNRPHIQLPPSIVRLCRCNCVCALVYYLWNTISQSILRVLMFLLGNRNEYESLLFFPQLFNLRVSPSSLYRWPRLLTSKVFSVQRCDIYHLAGCPPDVYFVTLARGYSRYHHESSISYLFSGAYGYCRHPSGCFGQLNNLVLYVQYSYPVGDNLADHPPPPPFLSKIVLDVPSGTCPLVRQQYGRLHGDLGNKETPVTQHGSRNA